MLLQGASSREQTALSEALRSLQTAFDALNKTGIVRSFHKSFAASLSSSLLTSTFIKLRHKLSSVLN